MFIDVVASIGGGDMSYRIAKGEKKYLYLSLKVRTLKAARLLGIRVTAKAQRTALLVEAGMLNAEQQKILLALSTDYQSLPDLTRYNFDICQRQWV